MFRALVLEEGPQGIAAAIREVDEAALPEGDVRVDVACSSLNFKDGLVLGGLGRIVRQYPHVPGVDLVGVVAESAHPDWRVGDAVIVTGFRMGEVRWGGYAQRARVQGDWCVRLPEGMTPRRAMALGTAGLTAMLGVLALEAHGVAPDKGPVLVTGATGGVGSVAVAALARRGYQVAALTGKPEHEPYLRSLGATTLVERGPYGQPPTRPLAGTRWQAAVDAVGGAPLANVAAELAWGGAIAVLGNVAGNEVPLNVLPLLLRQVALLGVDSVACPLPERRAAWKRLAEDLPGELLDGMTEVAPLAEAPRLGAEIRAGKLRGRVVIDVNA